MPSVREPDALREASTSCSRTHSCTFNSYLYWMCDRRLVMACILLLLQGIILHFDVLAAAIAVDCQSDTKLKALLCCN